MKPLLWTLEVLLVAFAPSRTIKRQVWNNTPKPITGFLLNSSIGKSNNLYAIFNVYMPNNPCIIVGDLNIIRNSAEKRDASIQATLSCLGLNALVQDENFSSSNLGRSPSKQPPPCG
jgi:hypothetical protein